MWCYLGTCMGSYGVIFLQYYKYWQNKNVPVHWYHCLWLSQSLLLGVHTKVNISDSALITKSCLNDVVIYTLEIDELEFRMMKWIIYVDIPLNPIKLTLETCHVIFYPHGILITILRYKFGVTLEHVWVHLG